MSLKVTVALALTTAVTVAAIYQWVVAPLTEFAPDRHWDEPAMFAGRP